MTILCAHLFLPWLSLMPSSRALQPKFPDLSKISTNHLPCPTLRPRNTHNSSGFHTGEDPGRLWIQTLSHSGAPFHSVPGQKVVRGPWAHTSQRDQGCLTSCGWRQLEGHQNVASACTAAQAGFLLALVAGWNCAAHRHKKQSISSLFNSVN